MQAPLRARRVDGTDDVVDAMALRDKQTLLQGFDQVRRPYCGKKLARGARATASSCCCRGFLSQAGSESVR
jgi:hypothetical protein